MTSAFSSDNCLHEQSLPHSYSEFSSFHHNWTQIPDQAQFVSCSYRKPVKSRSIMMDMVNLDVPNSVKEKSEEIYLQMNIKTKKGTERKKLIYYCITSSYKELQLPYLPSMIAHQLGLKISDVSNVSSKYSYSITGYRPKKSVRYRPENYIKILYGTIGISSGYEEYLIQMTKNIIDKDQQLLNSMPHIVAAGVILYFMESANLEYNSKIETILNEKERRLMAMKDRIKRIHNQKN